MKINFIPIEYDYFDYQGKNYVKIIGRDNFGKRICVIDKHQFYFWAILKKDLTKQQIEKLQNKINKIKLDTKGRQTQVEKTELLDKNYLGKKVKAIKIFVTNYKDAHEIASHLGLPEIEKRRGYDINLITHYIIEKRFNPLCWYEIQGQEINDPQFFGGISNIDVDLCLKLESIHSAGGAGGEAKSDFIPKTLA